MGGGWEVSGLRCWWNWVLWTGEKYIFVSLDAAPPAIFWTRSWPSSVFSSSSCFLRSSLFFVHSWAVFTFPDD
jgi:membrane-associated PAP2 superfamily phosphatase